MAIERIDSSADDARREELVDKGMTYAGAEALLREERRAAESLARRRAALASGAMQSVVEPEQRIRRKPANMEPLYNPTPDTSEPISPESLQVLSLFADENHDGLDSRRLAQTNDPVWVAAKRRAEDIKRGRIKE